MGSVPESAVSGPYPPRRPDPTVGTDVFHRGCHGTRLERLFRLVDPARVLVLQYERNVDDPAGELARASRPPEVSTELTQARAWRSVRR